MLVHLELVWPAMCLSLLKHRAPPQHKATNQLISTSLRKEKKMDASQDAIKG